MPKANSSLQSLYRHDAPNGRRHRPIWIQQRRRRLGLTDVSTVTEDGHDFFSLRGRRSIIPSTQMKLR